MGRNRKYCLQNFLQWKNLKRDALKGVGPGSGSQSPGIRKFKPLPHFLSPPPPLPSVWRLTLCFLGSVTKQSRAAFISQSGQTSKFPSTNQDQKRHKTKLNTDLAHAHFPALGIGCMPFKSVVTGLSDLVFWHYHSH